MLNLGEEKLSQQKLLDYFFHFLHLELRHYLIPHVPQSANKDMIQEKHNINDCFYSNKQIMSHLSIHSFTIAKFPSPIVLPTLYLSAIDAGTWKPSSNTSERIINTFLLVVKETQMLHVTCSLVYGLENWKPFRIYISFTVQQNYAADTVYTQQVYTDKMMKNKTSTSSRLTDIQVLHELQLSLQQVHSIIKKLHSLL